MSCPRAEHMRALALNFKAPSPPHTPRKPGLPTVSVLCPFTCGSSQMKGLCELLKSWGSPDSLAEAQELVHELILRD